MGTSPPEARYCADDRTPAGVDVVPGVGTCCLNASGDASCVAKTAACFHGSGPRRCDVLLKYFGSFDRRTWEERDYWDTSGWNERSSPSVFAADGELVRARLCGNQIYGAFVLNSRVDLNAIDATPARWRGGVGSSPLDGTSAATSSPRNDLVKNYRCTRHTG